MSRLMSSTANWSCDPFATWGMHVSRIQVGSCLNHVLSNKRTAAAFLHSNGKKKMAERTLYYRSILPANDCFGTRSVR